MDKPPTAASNAVEVTIRDHYGQQYGSFADDLFGSVRAEACGEDFGQNSWQTAAEHDRLRSWLALNPSSRLLDVASGSGGPTLRMTQRSGCHAIGVEIQADGVAAAKAAAERAGLLERVRFQQHDANHPLPFADATFDAVLCIDAINHLPDRPAVLREWWRVLRPGGRLAFTDPIIMTGPLSNEEVAIRAAIAYFLFVPLGHNDHVLTGTGFAVEVAEDRTEDIALVAGRWHDARAKREADLRAIEGDERYTKQQVFFAMCARLAAERRLSRYAYLARKPASEA
jgi:SAM-dependent methyltransferase